MAPRPLLTTPPSSPFLKAVKLKSPTKRFPVVPTSPHRPEMDLFWDQEAMNDWNDEYSPQKILGTVKLDDSPIKAPVLSLFNRSGSPSKPVKAVRDAKKAFELAKRGIADRFLLELDDVMCQGRIGELAASTGGVKIIWSRKLNTTAGRANWKREALKPSTIDFNADTSSSSSYRHYASIELAEKVIDDEHRLLNVLAHEFCHLTNFMITNMKTNPHGKEFKAWASKCSQAFGSRGIQVTTKHSYEIEYKYIWECDNCGLQYKRHSRSIDPVKHRCGTCKALLVQIKPVPRVCSSNVDGGMRKISEYQTFIKENMKAVREENPGSPQKDIMGLVAKKYKERQARKYSIPSTSVAESKDSNSEKTELVLLTRGLDKLDLEDP